jgi:hypothetical protein
VNLSLLLGGLFALLLRLELLTPERTLMSAAPTTGRSRLHGDRDGVHVHDPGHPHRVRQLPFAV